MNWPKSLIAEIAERRCIVVMGAGVSASCISADGTTHPPDWETLLSDALQEVRDDSDRKLAKELMGKKAYLDAAQIIVDKSHTADLTKFLRDKFVNPKFSPSDIHKIVGMFPTCRRSFDLNN